MMNAIHSKSSYLYGQIRRDLQAGRYLPGQRIDPATVAGEYRTSLTPVRFALSRLVGYGMLCDQPRAGFHVPMPTEMQLRDLYDWMERLLVMACEFTAARPLEAAPAPMPGDDDIPKQTWKLFDTIGRQTRHGALHHAIKRTNDRLAAIRRAKHELIDHAGEELVDLERAWQARDMPRLDSALRAYHQRRRQLVPCIVAHIAERRSQLH